MKTIPEINSRIVYSFQPSWGGPLRQCVGTVVSHYPGGDKCRDDETGEEWTRPHHVGVKVDAPLPEWWPYNGTDRFAPSIDDLEPS